MELFGNRKARAIGRAAAQLAEAVKLAQRVPDTAALDYPGLRHAGWAERGRLGRWRADRVAVLIPHSVFGSDQILYERCQDLVENAVSVHEAVLHAPQSR